MGVVGGGRRVAINYSAARDPPAPTARGYLAIVHPDATTVLGDRSTPNPRAVRKRRVVLDLCAGSGAWSAPYRAAGYTVLRADVLHGIDVRDLRHVGTVQGVLAAPPCTVFSVAANGVNRTETEMREAFSVLDACCRVILMADPVWWALENPRSHLQYWLGEPALKFQPWWYGDEWTKETWIWGKFNLPARTNENRAPGRRLRSMTEITHSAAKRAVTPPGFARAFFAANP